MNKLRVVPFVLALSALAVAAQGQPIELKVGRADSEGTVRMLLVHGEASHSVEVPIAPMSADEKAAALSQAISQEASGQWRAPAQGRVLTFEHLVEGVWLDVDAVKDFSDETGSSNQLAKGGGDAVFHLMLAADSAASGVDATGQSSFFTVTVTDTLAWTHPLQQGETAEQVLGLLAAFLQEEGGLGVEVTQLSATHLKIQLDYAAPFFNWQVTDTLLQPKAAGEKDAGVVDR